MSTENSPGPHITPALMRRIEALGFTPGSGEPVDWLIRDHLRLREALNDADAAHGATIVERDELAATLANERAAWVDMRKDVLQGGWTGGYPIEINDVLRKVDEYMPDACTMPAASAAWGAK